MKHFLIASLLSLSLSCDKKDSDHLVEYKVECNECFITFNSKFDETIQTNARGGWHEIFRVEKGHFVYISAQNQLEEGTVKVEILIDEELFRSSSQTGAYVIATARGSVPD